MSLRISSLALLAALLAGCGEPSGEPEGATVACAIGPGAEMADVCTLEKISATEFVIHHPGGGFRRFSHGIENGSLRLQSTDGADELGPVALDAETGDMDFAIAADRYRLNADLIDAAVADPASDE